MNEQIKQAAAKVEAAQKEAASQAEATAKKAAKEASETGERVKAEVEAFAERVPEAIRDMAERNVRQTREAYDRFRAAAEETTDLMEDSYASAQTGMTEIQVKMLEAAKANSSAYFDLARDLMQAKSVAEIVELNTAYTRRQFDQLSAQTQDVSAILRKVADDASQPLKVGLERSFETLRKAG